MSEHSKGPVQPARRVCTNCGRKFMPARKYSKVCSRPCIGGRNRKPESWWLNNRGYLEGRIWEGRKQRRVKQHRLVMERHLGRKLRGDEDVHHINGIKIDNRLDNLQLVSHGKHSTTTNHRRWGTAPRAHKRAALKKAGVET